MGIVTSTNSQTIVRCGILWQDQQHSELLRCIRNLQQKILDKTLDMTELNRIRTFLVWYVDLHFATEEAYMAELAYPGRAAHKAEHEGMTNKLMNLFEVIEDGMGHPDLHACAQLCVDLNKWYLSHIAGPDQDLAAFLKQQGVR
ncbi:MAG: hypothetical protein EA402_06940 [Planctomycetota bacterium]|nr:MAG: hypothetical protein EA402_06940 [Planctomycetota bacterium]